MDSQTIKEMWPDKLVRWYKENYRKLPWRADKDPYHVWISEIMLQQTRIEAVIGYYDRFMHRFPDIRSLAEADEEEVIKAWEGLGYYSRARNLHKAAKLVEDRFQGLFPREYEEIKALPGIGPYTAGAIAAMAFDQPEAAVDGNVLRVFSRIYNDPEDVLKDTTRKKAALRTKVLIPEGEAAAYTQGIMELGETICIPASPDCGRCPLKEDCQAYQAGTARDLPVRNARTQKKEIDRLVLVIRQNDTVLLTKRPEKGVLAGMWEFPGVDMLPEDPVHSLAVWEDRFFPLDPDTVRSLFTATHVFTHIKWTMHVYVASPAGTIPSGDVRVWADRETLKNMALPSAFRRIREYIFASET